MARLVALLALILVLAGCGLGPGEERKGGAELRVTRDFGRQQLGAKEVDHLPEGQTVMRLLRSEFEVDTRYGGRFVQSIDGLSGKGAAGRVDWFYFVNGIEASEGAAEYELSPGDVVQWDYRRWDTAMRVPAIVGAFPAPFTTAVRGRRFPVRVECDDASSDPCEEVKRRLRELHVRATGASLGAQGVQNVIRVLVGQWPEPRLVRAAAALDRGPDQSGVFARFVEGGRSLELLDERGKAVRRAPPGTGLVAALSPSEEEIVWLLTARDERGLEAAASALDERTLRDAYAVAVTPDGAEELPLAAR
jgi:uncharacterized protein DUF4430